MENTMEEINGEEVKQKFIELYETNIKREGAKELLDWLKKTDFFTAPASTKFHSACEYGLCNHSINVYNRFKSMLDREYGDKRKDIISDESIAIMGLLHDVCKIDCYKVDYRNTKVDGEWVKVPFYVYDDTLPYGHGEKSVYMISGFMRLTREEAIGINWHMGGFDKRVIGGDYGLATAFYAYPTAVMLHLADISATYLDESK